MRTLSKLKCKTHKQFKKQILELNGPVKTNPYFAYGSRLGNMLHTQLRLKSSRLNHHRYLQGKTNTPTCRCGHAREDTRHFLLDCPIYLSEREAFFARLQTFLQIDFRNLPRSKQLDLLMHGPQSDSSLAKLVAKCCQSFVLRTKQLSTITSND